MIDFDPDDLPSGVRLPTIIDEGLALDKRPGALSLDYLTSYTIGPVQQGDFSLGLADRIWKIRIYDQSIRLARENNDRTGFEPETLLVNLDFQPKESDAAFDQQGRLFVCMEYAGEMWLYWFNSFLGIFEVANFGAGRSPPCTLDQLTNRVDSDLHVFYTDEVSIKYRVQRENYAVVHDTGYPVTFRTHLEDAAITQGGRVVVLVSNMDVEGHYSFERTFSKLLPITFPEESLFESLDVQSGIILVVLQTVAPPGFGSNFLDDVEEYHEGLTIQSGICVIALILHTLFDVEQWHEGLTIQSGICVIALILHTLFDIEQWHEGLTIQSGILAVIVITHTLFDIEQWHEGLTIISGTLV